MAQTHDVTLDGAAYSVVPGSYRKRNKRTGGRAASIERLTIDQFDGLLQAFGGGAGEGAPRRGWGGLRAGPAFEGQGVEPFPVSFASFDSVADIPGTTTRAHGLVAGNRAYVGIGQRLYRSVLLDAGAWGPLSVAVDFGAGFVISGLGYFQDDVMVFSSSGNDLRRHNTASGNTVIWRSGERGQVGCGYAGQLMYAPRAANAQEELRISGVRWNGAAVTHKRYLDSPIVSMALYNGKVAIATKTSLWLMGGQPYEGQPDEVDISGDQSRPAAWIGEPEPLMTHGTVATGDDFTFLCSYRGRLYTWLAGHVVEYDGDRTWTRMGPEGVRCYGGAVVGDWLVTAIEGRAGIHELWGFDGAGWWRLHEDLGGALVWPCPVGGAGGVDLLTWAANTPNYYLSRLRWRSAAAHTYAGVARWESPLLDAGNPSAVKSWRAVGAEFAQPANRGNAASLDGVTIGLDYSTDAGATWTVADSLTTSAASDRTFRLEAAFADPVEARYLQLRVRWDSVLDWAPVLASVWAEHMLPEVLPATARIW
ncbi:MAG: hypothetical protein IT338_20585, partial [Thermomicrobiales bacterium]|nr:hypothetical protein [Thermomicrobiales bacterium]